MAPLPSFVCVPPRFPVTMYAVCGTQADSAAANKLTVMKMTELHKTQTKAHDSDESSDDVRGFLKVSKIERHTVRKGGMKGLVAPLHGLVALLTYRSVFVNMVNRSRMMRMRAWMWTPSWTSRASGMRGASTGYDACHRYGKGGKGRKRRVLC